MKSEVAIVDYSSIKDGMKDALDLIKCSKLFCGKHVVIKPNDVAVIEGGIKTACTQPDTLQAVIQYVKSFSPKSITITGGSAMDTSIVFEMLGFDKIIKDEKVNFLDHNKPPFVELTLDKGTVIVNPNILVHDVLISLAQHKVHDVTLVSLSMKNIAMSFPASDYYGYPRREKISHGTDIHEFIVMMCKRCPPTISIVVGHPVMIENGPIGGKTFESNLIIAGTDFVAVDSVAANLLGMFDVPHIILAEKEGLGIENFDNIEILGIQFNEAKRIFDKRK
jgi:uncharacterized protein (DUF362 family)